MNMNTYKISDTNLFLGTAPKKSQYSDGVNDKVYKINDLPNDKKPRERLIEYGPTALETKELLAIILGTGTKKEDLMKMASRIVSDYGKKTLSSQKDAQALAKDLSIPLIKAQQVVSAIELGRRLFEKDKSGTTTIRTPKDVFNYVKDMRELPKEHLRGIYLNSRHKVIHDEVLSIGTINTNIIHPREVFRPALEYSAAAVIIVHNHPSNDPTPSEQDIAITDQIVRAGQILGIELLDHIIVTKNKFISINLDKNNE